MDFLHELRGRFAATLAPVIEDAEPYAGMLRAAGDPKFGDFQANMAMPLGKALGRPPREIAAEIVGRLEVADLCETPEIAGPGFINLRIRDDRLAAETKLLAADARLGVTPVAAPQTVVIDYSAPNVAKPMHVGHLRSTVIGDCLCRVYRLLGHRVIGDNHIGDWGTQFGMILYGYKNLLDAAAFQREPVTELARLYRLVSQVSSNHASADELPKLAARIEDQAAQIKAVEAAAGGDKAAKKSLSKLNSDLETLREQYQSAQQQQRAWEADAEFKRLADAHPDIAAAARRETAKLHAGDPENVRLWNEFLPACLAALHRVYARLGVAFDHELGESFYHPLLNDVVRDLEAKALAQTSEGAVCVFNEGFATPFLVRKADGAFLYATTDLATIRYRVDNWSADVLLYVVDKRQSDHFEQLFATARRWGYNEATFRHVSFGTILGDDRKPFKTRSGDTVGLESLLDEAVERAYRIVSEGDDAKSDGPELDDAERQRIAEIVGLGGIKYADLKHNRESDYVFSWEKMLSTTGDTATYMQYAYARIGGIARRGGIDPDMVRSGAVQMVFDQPEERALALQLNRFSEAVAAVARDNRPNVLTEYLLALAGAFTSFYDKCPVLKAEPDGLRSSRLALCDLTARTLAAGLNLLGIAVSERM